MGLGYVWKKLRGLIGSGFKTPTPSALRTRTPLRKSLNYLSLEDRCVPATFNIPWSDARHLTLSFVPEGTPIASQSSQFSAILPNQSVSVSQREILRAFQTWASRTNINIGLTTDSGLPMGVVGSTHLDPRFGDIRIGAIPLNSGAMSISIPPSPALSGTWAGDVIFNTTTTFGSNQIDLFGVALHEAGHVFGLDSSPNPTSAMFNQYNGNPIKLSSEDITQIQALYGVRLPDQWEGSSGNNTLNKATRIPSSSNGFNGSTPLVIFGDITSNSDIDYFSVRPLSGYSGPMTFRLQSKGISLLAPRLTILNSKGQIVGRAASVSPFGDIATVRLAQVNPRETYFLRVEGATKDVFGIGSYGVAVTFDRKLKTPVTTIDRVLRSHYDSLPPSEMQKLFANPEQVYLNEDNVDREAIGKKLPPVLGYSANTHFETIASLSRSTDRDTYTVKSPSSNLGSYPVLSVMIRSLTPSIEGIPQVEISDRLGNQIPFEILANDHGVLTVQAFGIQANREYSIVVYSNPPRALGNYALNVDFNRQPVQMRTFTTGNLSPDHLSTSRTFYVAQSQLFQFLLGVQSSDPNETGGVQMTVFDSTGKTVLTLRANVGSTISTPSILLAPGTYQVRFEAIGLTGPISFRLSGDRISDPIGPLLDDPTIQPIVAYPGGPTTGYIYPGQIISFDPFLWIISRL